MIERPVDLRAKVLLATTTSCLWLSVGLLVLVATNRVQLTSSAREAFAFERAVDARLEYARGGTWDTANDPDVGRVLKPHLRQRPKRGMEKGLAIWTNARGMREQSYERPKPENRIRVVLLGDSYVYGLGVDMDERVGSHLQTAFRERASLEVECLHLGVPSWNIRAATEFLRRQLSDIGPDLVIHYVMNNDLDDVTGVRGFGVPARLSPQNREWGDGLIFEAHPRQSMGFSYGGLLPFGLDWFSQERYRDASKRIERLAHAVREQGGEYLLLLNWWEANPTADEWLAPGIDRRHRVYVPSSLREEEDARISDGDFHWSPSGHRRMAQVLYEVVRRERLLGDRVIAEWGEAKDAYETIAVEGRAEIEKGLSGKMEWVIEQRRSEIDFERLDDIAATQIHGGVDRLGRVSPRAALLLRRGGASLRVEGRALSRSELEWQRVEIFVDGVHVGGWDLSPSAPIQESFELPEASVDREDVSVVFQCEDYVYDREDPRHLVSFQLSRIAVVP